VKAGQYTNCCVSGSALCNSWRRIRIRVTAKSQIGETVEAHTGAMEAHSGVFVWSVSQCCRFASFWWGSGSAYKKSGLPRHECEKWKSGSWSKWKAGSGPLILIQTVRSYHWLCFSKSYKVFSLIKVFGVKLALRRYQITCRDASHIMIEYILGLHLRKIFLERLAVVSLKFLMKISE
jgi:hypothetical protein